MKLNINSNLILDNLCEIFRENEIEQDFDREITFFLDDDFHIIVQNDEVFIVPIKKTRIDEIEYKYNVFIDLDHDGNLIYNRSRQDAVFGWQELTKKMISFED